MMPHPSPPGGKEWLHIIKVNLTPKKFSVVMMLEVFPLGKVWWGFFTQLDHRTAILSTC